MAEAGRETLLSFLSDVESDWRSRTKVFRDIAAQPHDGFALADSDNEDILDFTDLAKVVESFEDDFAIVIVTCNDHNIWHRETSAFGGTSQSFPRRHSEVAHRYR